MTVCQVTNNVHYLKRNYIKKIISGRGLVNLRRFCKYRKHLPGAVENMEGIF